MSVSVIALVVYAYALGDNTNHVVSIPGMTLFVTCPTVFNLMRKLVFYAQTKPPRRRQLHTGFPIQHHRHVGHLARDLTGSTAPRYPRLMENGTEGVGPHPQRLQALNKKKIPPLTSLHTSDTAPGSHTP